jgi:Zn-dependent protease with chaperone function
MVVHALAASILAVLVAGCSAAPRGAYFPPPGDAHSARIAHVLHRAAIAAGDEPARYSFAFIASPVAVATSDEEATFYVTEGLARQPLPVIDAAIAHEVAHEVLGHVGTRRMLSISLSAGFTVLGLFFPGTGLIDFLASPLAIRAFTRSQELDADQRAVEILRAMGHDEPRKSLSQALRALAATKVRPKEEPPGLLSPHPSLADRLAALEPLESAGPAVARQRPPQ